MTAVAVEVEPVYRPPRWLLVITGILWLIVALVLLSLDPTGAAAIGYLVAFVLIFGGIDEFMYMAIAEGWKWLHAALGVLFILGGLAALLSPLQTFGILALLIGWFLVIKGFFDIVKSIAFRDVIPLWGLTLTAGILEVALGLWAIGYPGRSAWLLMVWIGVGALLRSIGDFVAAFSSRGD